MENKIILEPVECTNGLYSVQVVEYRDQYRERPYNVQCLSSSNNKIVSYSWELSLQDAVEKFNKLVHRPATPQSIVMLAVRDENAV